MEVLLRNHVVGAHRDVGEAATGEASSAEFVACVVFQTSFSWRQEDAK
jgi:hypothetical protein